MINEFKYGQTWTIWLSLFSYHFTVPLKVPNSKLSCQLKGKRLNRGPGHGLEIPVIY